jgi:tetratricopeptide (TPR) repeat protein
MVGDARADFLEQKDALALLDALEATHPSLKDAGPAERQRLCEATCGNPLLLRWTVGQLGRQGSRCHSADEACAFLARVPPGEERLEHVFGDLLDTCSKSEIAVLAALTCFSFPIHVRWIADVAGLTKRWAQGALDDLDERALLLADPGACAFALSLPAIEYLKRKRPEAIARAGDRLAERALAFAMENGWRQYDRFPSLEAAWPALAAALPLLFRGPNARFQQVCDALTLFLDFSGRWDERLWLSHAAEERAVAEGDLSNAGWRAYEAGFAYHLRDQAAEVLACADRAAAHWQKIGAGTRERAFALRLRGIGHQVEKNYPAAIAAYSQAVAQWRSLDRKGADLVVGLNDLAEVEKATGDLARAERLYRRALHIARKVDDRDGLAYITGNLAELALERKDWPAAERLARAALSRSEGIGRQELVAHDCHCLATALARQGKPDEGLPYARCAVEIYSTLKKPDGMDAAQAALRACSEP